MNPITDTGALHTGGDKKSPALVQICACLLMFCMPWAGDVEIPGSGIVSLGFNMGAAGLILYWGTTVRSPFRSLPWAFSAFSIFILLHCIVVHGLMHPSELFTRKYVDLGGHVEIRSSYITLLLRVTLFILITYSMSSLINNLRLMKNMAFSLGASIVIILILGGASSISPLGARFSGGYSNPNSFASVALLLGYLVTFVLTEKRFSFGTRVLAGGLLMMSVMVILMTASRSALVSLAGGGAVFLITGDVKKGIVYSLIIIAMAAAIATMASSSVLGYAFSRFTSGESNARIFIWVDYLRNWREYVALGVGLGREITVLKSLTLHGRIWVPHNTYLRILIAFGTTGFLLFNYFLWSMMSSAVRLQRAKLGDHRSKLLIAFLVSLLIQMFFGGHFVNRMLWVGLGIVGAYLSIYEKELLPEQELPSQ